MPVKGCRGSEVDDRHLNRSGRLNHQCHMSVTLPCSLKPFVASFQQNLPSPEALLKFFEMSLSARLIMGADGWMEKHSDGEWMDGWIDIRTD